MSQPYTPKFLNPSVDNLLSTSATPAFQSKYRSSRGAADPIGQLRYRADRLGSSGGGAGQSPSVVWDTGYLGTPTITAMPLGRYSFGCAQYRDRVYITGGADAAGNVKGDVWSAPVGGGSIGSWREEKPMAVRPATNSGGAILIGRHGHGCTAANFGTASVSTNNPNQKGQGGQPWLICYGGFQAVSGFAGDVNASSTMIAAPIYADGVLGDWITISYSGWGGLAWCDLIAVPNQYVTTALVLSGGVSVGGGLATSSSWATIIRSAPASAQSGADWDAPQNWWRPLTTSGAPQTAGHRMAYDWANSTLLWFKGTSNSGGSPQYGWYYSGFGVDVSTWNYSNLGNSWGAGAAADGTTAQQNAALVYFGAQAAGGTGGSPTSQVYLIGGTSSTTNVGDTSTPLNLVSYTTITWSSGAPIASAWTHSATVIPAAVTGCRAFLHEHGLEMGQLYGYPPWCDRNKVYLSLLGGATGIGSVTNAARTTSLPAVPGSGGYTTSGGNISAWLSGAGGGLTAGDLGTGGTLVNNQDGSQDASVTYGQITTPGTLVNGDRLQVTVWQSSKVSGDLSPPRSTLLRVGQAPSISGLGYSSTATGQPTISFNFNSGAGASDQQAWQVRLTRISDSALIFDSGVRYTHDNSVQVQCAPWLVSGTAYTITATVWSGDILVNGTQATASQTLGLTPSLAAAPSAPSSVSVSADSTNGWDLLSWTNASGTSSNRIYSRRTGSSIWTLLVDGYTAGAGAQSVKLMDRIPFGVSLDFAVSAVGSVANESALSSPAVAVTLTTPTGVGGWLHVAGQPLTGALGAPVMFGALPKWTVNYAAKVQQRWGGSRVVIRQGPSDYRSGEIHFYSRQGLNQKALTQITDQLILGKSAYFRDDLGAIFPVTLSGSEDIEYHLPKDVVLTLRVSQTDDLFAPYVAQDSALGMWSLSNGSIPPSDALELVA